MRYPDDYINKVIQGDCLDVLKTFEDNSVDTIITDPPYGLGFMGKQWDTFDKSQFGKKGEEGKNDLKVKKNFNILPRYNTDGLYQFTKDWATEALRVLKPGGTALIFAGSRTQHKVASGVEDAGFELRDCIMWIYGSGFPKATDISKQLDKGHEREVVGKKKFADGSTQRRTARAGIYSEEKGQAYETIPTTPEAKLWNGWKSHGLKPAYEPILVAMKPNEGTYAANALKHGVAGLNIDGGRIGTETEIHSCGKRTIYGGNSLLKSKTRNDKTETKNYGRFPANIILDEEAGKMLDEQSGELKSGKMSGIYKNTIMKNEAGTRNGKEIYLQQESSKGGASRFFYCAKSSRSERLLNGFYCAKLDEWKGKKEKDENMEQVQLLARATLDLVAGNLSIEGYGNSTTDAYPKESISTIRTEINKITELKIWNSLTQQPTKEYIADVFGKKMDGGNPVGYAKNSKELMTKIGIFQEKVGLATGDVKNATLELLLKLKGNVAWQDAYSHHPTHKPLALMEYLCKLTETPTKGIVLDPFAGSGTTLIAAKNLGRPFIGIEREKEYVEIAEARLKGLPNKLF